MLHVIVPGLLDRPTRDGKTVQPRLPQLERLFKKGDKQPVSASYAATLFDLYGIPHTPNQDLPSAAICYHADAEVTLHETYFLHADPIHLKPDQDRLLAFDFQQQPLTEAEAKQFSAAFNPHFAADGLRLLTPSPNHWYVSVNHTPGLQTRPLADVTGRNIDLFLPQGPDAQQWLSWMNEIQMLFYNLPVNQQRENYAQLPVNGLWFSGGGKLPATSGVGFAQAEGDCILLRGLQKLATEHKDEHLIVEHALGRAAINNDLDAWLDAAQRLDAKLDQLMQNELMLYACQGVAWHWRPGKSLRNKLLGFFKRQNNHA